jgi:voltage-gated potassium channel
MSASYCWIAMNSQDLTAERHDLLGRLSEWLETPMLVLGLAWLVLLVIELTRGLTRFLELVGTAIWIIFVIEFAIRFAVAPRKLAFVKNNWLTILALAVPAIRAFRIVRIARVLRVGRAARGVRLFRVISSINRGMRALGASLGRRGFGYIVGLTAIVVLAGAAGIQAFEHDVPDQTAIRSYGDALWWTAMLITTMGSDYWPRSPEGRLLCLLLALYAFAVFGYVTATLASYFVGRDADSSEGEVVGAAAVEALRSEIAALRDEVRALRR